MQIYTKGEGLVEFNSLDEMDHVIKKLDDTKFKGEYIRLTVSRHLKSWKIVLALLYLYNVVCIIICIIALFV